MRSFHSLLQRGGRGEAAAGESWRGPTDKYVRRMHEVRSIGLGFTRALINYRTHALPVLQFVAQFEVAPLATMKAERRCSQLLISGPWDAIPIDMMHQLVSLGSKAELPCLRAINRAAMFRAATMSQAYWKMNTLIDQALDSDDRLILPRHTNWVETAHISQLRKNKTILDGIAPRLSFTQHGELQRAMVKTLRGKYDGRNFNTILHDRLNYWMHTTDNERDTVLENLRSIGKTARPLLFIAALRTVCNGWNTSARFHKQVLRCRLCCAESGDDQRHYAQCPGVLHYVCSRMPKISMRWKAFLMLEPCSAHQAVGMAIVHDLVISAINSLRHQCRFLEGEATQNELHGRMKDLIRKDLRIQKIVAYLK